MMIMTRWARHMGRRFHRQGARSGVSTDPCKTICGCICAGMLATFLFTLNFETSTSSYEQRHKAYNPHKNYIARRAQNTNFVNDQNSAPRAEVEMSGVPRGLRACLVCAFVQPYTKWSRSGCPNCEDFLEMKNSSDTIGDCTSEVFEGLVTVNDTSTGWVSRWLRISGFVPGVYATKVNGVVSRLRCHAAPGGLSLQLFTWH